LGQGKYGLDLGLNVYGLLICTCGFLIGAAVQWQASFGSPSQPQALPK
jgi:SSS family solute:Na+ symporter